METSPIDSKIAAISDMRRRIKVHLQPSNYFSEMVRICICGDSRCLDLCDIRQLLPKLKVDNKVRESVFLIGELYLQIGDLYKTNGELHRALKTVEVASLLYVSMPNSWVDGSTSESNFPKMFWSNAWNLVGDIYSEHYRLQSNEVTEEDRKLMRNSGEDSPNWDICSITGCSCRSDRADTGKSASTSTSTDSGTKFSKKIGGSTKLTNAGIFKFLEGPKFEDIENNLNSAIQCYKVALEVNVGIVADSDLVKQKMGSAYNDLGLHKLDKSDFTSAERQFQLALRSFQEANDHRNLVVTNCNLGVCRRALAEDAISKNLKAFKRAKSDYHCSLEYYTAAKKELSHVIGGIEREELKSSVLTKYADTCQQLGMLLARESLSYGHEKTEKNNEKICDTFKECLSTLESLGGTHKQKLAFCYHQLGCYHRDMCTSVNKSREWVEQHHSLAEKNYKEALNLYGCKTHPNEYITISMELSALSSTISTRYDLSSEAPLMYLLEGRHVVEVNEDNPSDYKLDIERAFWRQLQALLKSMLSASRLGSTKASQSGSGSGSGSGSAPSSPASNNRVLDSSKLKEMYRMSLVSPTMGQLHVMYNYWLS